MHPHILRRPAFLTVCNFSFALALVLWVRSTRHLPLSTAARLRRAISQSIFGELYVRAGSESVQVVTSGK